MEHERKIRDQIDNERKIMNSLLFVDVVAELGRLRTENEQLKNANERLNAEIERLWARNAALRRGLEGK